MKNLSFIYFSFIFALLLSCSDDECTSYTCIPQEHAHTSELLANIQAFNDSLSATKQVENHPSQISGKDALKGASYLWVAARDVYGAYKGYKLGSAIGAIFGPETSVAGGVIGGLVKGSYSSYKAYKRTKFMRTIILTDSVKTPDMVIRAYGYGLDNGFNPSLNTPSSIILKWPANVTPPTLGASHNMILRNLQESKFSNYPANTYLTEDEQKVINSEEFKADFNAMVTDESMDIEIDENSNEVEDIVMSLFLQVYQDYPEKAEDVEFITNKYIELIDTSTEISDADKEKIYSALSVAASSYEYWKQNTDTQDGDE